jgi:hypothetical protein
MITLLTALTCLATLMFLAVVARALIKICHVLDSIGGSGESYLAKLRLGLRAIERETSHLPAAAPVVNKRLGEIAAGLTALDGTLGGLHKALLAQEGGKR